MAEVFVISDLHLGHANILNFMNGNNKLRPFYTLEEMHDTIIKGWYSVVTPKDKVYVLGDVCFRIEYMEIFNRLPGHKRLVRGNHDLFDTPVYLKYFDEIYGVRQLNGVWLTHVPMHEDSVNAPRVKCNIHGHLHANKINHPKYFNASVECINYTPISIDDVLKGIED